MFCPDGQIASIMMTLAGHGVNGQIYDRVLVCTNQPDPHSSAVNSNLQTISDEKKREQLWGKGLTSLAEEHEHGGGVGGLKVTLETEGGKKNSQTPSMKCNHISHSSHFGPTTPLK